MIETQERRTKLSSVYLLRGYRFANFFRRIVGFFTRGRVFVVGLVPILRNRRLGRNALNAIAAKTLCPSIDGCHPSTGLINSRRLKSIFVNASEYSRCTPVLLSWRFRSATIVRNSAFSIKASRAIFFR